MHPGPDDICYLLGAGASVPAKVRASGSMIKSLEEGFSGKNRQKPAVSQDFKDLYWHVKCSIQFAQGLEGKPELQGEFNIETLVRALTELERHIGHPLYPFVATWNQRLWDLAGNRFQNVANFKDAVLSALQGWILVENLDQNSAYYGGLKDFRRSLEHPLRIFSLNYDRCIETLEGNTDNPFHVEQGFGSLETNPERTWDWHRMQSDLAGRDNVELRNADVFLYKLHGSIDWTRDDDEQLVLIDPANIRTTEMKDVEIIFGKEAKLDARDPFSFYFSEFRRACKAASLVIVIGYSFADPHVNQILAGALRERNSQTKLLIITRESDSGEALQSDEDDEVSRVARRLAGESNSVNVKKMERHISELRKRIFVRATGAEVFLKETTSWSSLSEYLPKGADPFAL